MKDTMSGLVAAYDLFVDELEIENEARAKQLEDRLEPTLENFMKWFKFQLKYKDVV